MAGDESTSIGNSSAYRPAPSTKPISPPYRMPPQPQNGNGIYSEASIPGTATTNEPQGTTNISLRTHSSKFPVSCRRFCWGNSSKIQSNLTKSSQHWISEYNIYEIVPICYATADSIRSNGKMCTECCGREKCNWKRGREGRVDTNAILFPY